MKTLKQEIKNYKNSLHLDVGILLVGIALTYIGALDIIYPLGDFDVETLIAVGIATTIAGVIVLIIDSMVLHFLKGRRKKEAENTFINIRES